MPLALSPAPALVLLWQGEALVPLQPNPKPTETPSFGIDAAPGQYRSENNNLVTFCRLQPLHTAVRDGPSTERPTDGNTQNMLRWHALPAPCAASSTTSAESFGGLHRAPCCRARCLIRGDENNLPAQHDIFVQPTFDKTSCFRTLQKQYKSSHTVHTVHIRLRRSSGLPNLPI